MKERGITTIEREINRDRESYSERNEKGEGYIERGTQKERERESKGDQQRRRIVKQERSKARTTAGKVTNGEQTMLPFPAPVHPAQGHVQSSLNI